MVSRSMRLRPRWSTILSSEMSPCPRDTRNRTNFIPRIGSPCLVEYPLCLDNLPCLIGNGGSQSQQELPALDEQCFPLPPRAGIKEFLIIAVKSFIHAAQKKP